MGTLVRLRPPAPRLQHALRSRLGVEITEAQAATALRAEIAYYRDHMHEGRDAASVAALQAACADVLAAGLPEIGSADPAQITAALLDALRFAAFPDAAPALRAARAGGATVIVVSNWDASLPRALRDAGLDTLVDGVIASGAAGVAKPDPRIFVLALARAGASARDAIHVGDSLDDDVAGARAAGIEAVWLNRDGAPVPAGVRAIRELGALALGGRA